MEMLEIVEKIVAIVCPIVSVIISLIALFKSNDAIKQVNKIKIGKIERKQEVLWFDRKEHCRCALRFRIRGKYEKL